MSTESCRQLDFVNPIGLSPSELSTRRCLSLRIPCRETEAAYSRTQAYLDSSWCRKLGVPRHVCRAGGSPDKHSLSVASKVLPSRVGSTRIRARSSITKILTLSINNTILRKLWLDIISIKQTHIPTQVTTVALSTGKPVCVIGKPIPLQMLDMVLGVVDDSAGFILNALAAGSPVSKIHSHVTMGGGVGGHCPPQTIPQQPRRGADNLHHGPPLSICSAALPGGQCYGQRNDKRLSSRSSWGNATS
ncbi:hypothetical protein KCU90_g1, partial [Aureobasidium melanogenum]